MISLLEDLKLQRDEAKTCLESEDGFVRTHVARVNNWLVRIASLDIAIAALHGPSPAPDTPISPSPEREDGADPTLTASEGTRTTLLAPKPPEGYTEIAAGARCRCINLWTDGRGGYFCCGGLGGGLAVAESESSDKIARDWLRPNESPPQPNEGGSETGGTVYSAEHEREPESV
jgi:hypothetical protein